MEKFYRVMVSGKGETFQVTTYHVFKDSLQAQACREGAENAFLLVNEDYSVFVIVEDEEGNQL